MQRIEIFSDEDLNELQTEINTYCSGLHLKPLSVSISTDSKSGEYIAAVVVKELNYERH